MGSALALCAIARMKASMFAMQLMTERIIV